MKNLNKLILLCTAILFVSCGGNPNYEKNLATAQKLFSLHPPFPRLYTCLVQSKNETPLYSVSTVTKYSKTKYRPTFKTKTTVQY